MASIYNHPDIYDLEHVGLERDVGFFQEFVKQHQPARILEYACGNGRVTFPLAEAAAAWNGVVLGLDASEPMLEAARRQPNPRHIEWHSGDVRSWRPDAPVDLILSACASLSHLLRTDDQIAAWRNAHASLAPGGRFLVAELAPDYPTMAEAMRIPGRNAVSFDGDFENRDERLLRCKAINYRADLQRLRVRYLYDHLKKDAATDRFVEDYDAHAYFPNELRLLFALGGFELENEWGSYDDRPLSHESRVLIFCGHRKR